MSEHRCPGAPNLLNISSKYWLHNVHHFTIHPLRNIVFAQWGVLGVSSPLIKVISQLMRAVAGWWLTPTPLKNHGMNVSGDDEIPNMMGKS
jgi:hypothetical protein